MKAYEIGEQQGLGSLRAVQRPVPEPGPGQVLLQVRMVALNHRDLLVLAGAYGPRRPPQRTPVSDGVGVVAALGAGVSGLAPGQRVSCAHFTAWLQGPWTPAHLQQDLGVSLDGWLAQYIVVPAAAVLPVPETLSDEQAAALPAAGTTAWHALVHLGGLQPGDRVLTLGSGGVSILALQLAHALGARVAITSSSDDKLERLRALGAEIGINYTRRPDWAAALREATHGDGADIVLETGGIATLAQSIDAAAANARIALVGALGSGGSVSNLVGVVVKNLTLRGLTSGPRAMHEELLQAVARHRIVPVVDRVFGFDEAAAAYAHLHAGRHIGKVLVQVTT